MMFRQLPDNPEMAVVDLASLERMAGDRDCFWRERDAWKAEALRLRDHLAALVGDVGRNLEDPTTIAELLEGARAALNREFSSGR